MKNVKKRMMASLCLGLLLMLALNFIPNRVQAAENGKYVFCQIICPLGGTGCGYSDDYACPPPGNNDPCEPETFMQNNDKNKSQND